MFLSPLARVTTHSSLIKNKIRQAQQYATAGASSEAATAYTQATQWALKSYDADINSEICSQGSVNTFAREVLPACERSVLLTPDAGDYIDNRGLARALTGNFSGAIQDFQFFINWAQHYNLYGKDLPQYIQERQQWIASMRAGQNPFNQAELNAIRNEYIRSD